jgi:G3E family GTPase
VPAFSNVIIEASGLADPVPVLQSLVADEALRHLYRVHDVVTLVDAVHGEAQLDTQGVAVKQAAVADALLVTKTDLASPHATRMLRERLAHMNPGAEICEVVRGDIDPALFLRGGVHDTRKKPAEVERWLKAAEHARAMHGVVKDHAHDARVRAFCLYHERTIRHAGLVMWLDMLAGLRGANLLRVKGILNVEGEPVVVQAVQTVVHEPVVLDAWPTADQRSRLVFIARDIGRDEIERTFCAFDYAPATVTKSAIDPAAYAQFVAAMKGFG